MSAHPLCAQADVASRHHPANTDFFAGRSDATITVSPVEEKFAYSESGWVFTANTQIGEPDSYDLVWLRMPPPLSHELLKHLKRSFRHAVLLNDPEGIWKTGSKAFLTKVAEWCPPLQICQTLQDIIDFKRQFPIVLKPFREYGGRGLVRIDGDRVWLGQVEMSFTAFAEQLPTGDLEYLGVKFLKNVRQGDKRIVVVNGEIMGASLRLPPPDSWICNVAMGGSSNPADVDDDERAIIAGVDEQLRQLGIVMYGVDTLVGDDGTRVLSELNTTSIGGLPQIARMRKEPLVERAVDLIWQFALPRLNSISL